MPAVVTLTLNPSIDESTSVDHVIPERKLRCGETVNEPGGGGINVSRVLRRFGHDAPAIYTSGGPAGALLARLLDAEGVPHWPVPIEEWTRENFNVLERSSGRQYRFVFRGPTLSADDVERCLGLLRGARPAPGFVVASGSLPPGVPTSFYASLTRQVRDAGGRLLLDASGAALREAAAAGVYLLKPSLREFEELTGRSGEDEASLVEAGRALVARGACELLVLSLGARGALWVAREGGGRVVAPTVPYASGVGAGDSMVAGILHALLRGGSEAEAVRFGVATAAASVMNPGTSLCRPGDAERLFRSLSG
ncbi:MAG TPA: 1-phosphofructokinase family hexose kinase [Thermoanaerobaculia bacterium]|nr:1-phosphofructokinase family hexose kinase [Thermoanaerobaculia bacterium]